jgi:MFS family permease
MQTLLASVWMMSRGLCFVVLGVTSWWHTRPRAMLIAAIVLLGSFLGTTLIPSLWEMILCQIALGASIGLIYSASLYFGMVLSDGSTEQNSYHEALIGLGTVLGPGCGALAGLVQPANPRASILAVGTVLWFSVIGASAVSLRAGQGHRRRISE